MEITYKFVTDEVKKVEVDETIGQYIENSRREESNGKRKFQRHNISLDQVVYEGQEFGMCDQYFIDENQIEECEKCKKILSVLTEAQRRRVLMFVQQKNLQQIADLEGVSLQSVHESIVAAKKKIKKFR